MNEMFASYTETSLDVSAAYGNDIPALQRHAFDIYVDHIDTSLQLRNFGVQGPTG